MSTVDEETVIVPWVGPLSCKNSLTVAVVSFNADITQKIAESLKEVHNRGEFTWKLIVTQSTHLEEIERQSDLTGRIALDFVIIAIDTGRMFCLEWAKKQIMHVHPDLRSRRVVLVNAGGLPMASIAVNITDLLTLKSDNKLDMLNADVMKSQDAVFLARRLIKYMEVSMGQKTGYPNINV